MVDEVEVVLEVQYVVRLLNEDILLDFNDIIEVGVLFLLLESNTLEVVEVLSECDEILLPYRHQILAVRADDCELCLLLTEHKNVMLEDEVVELVLAVLVEVYEAIDDEIEDDARVNDAQLLLAEVVVEDEVQLVRELELELME